MKKRIIYMYSLIITQKKEKNVWNNIYMYA